jgi:isoquinoline 1-oxidoreductase beta subunit
LRAQLQRFYTGVEQENITVNGTFLGGGFGRRGYVDFAGEAAAVAVKMPGVPVKLMWSREDDMQHDYYRPATFHTIEASLDELGLITGWRHNLVGTSIMKGFGVDLMEGLLPSWVPSAIANKMGHGFADFVSDYDITMGEGAKIPYAIENRKVGMVHHDPGVPTGFWRSVSHSFNAFIVEGFINELAYEAKSDALQFRLGMLEDQPRHRKVLELLKKYGPWGSPPDGIAQGIAVHESFGSVVAMLIEISSNGLKYKVHRVVCAIDCGLVINPDLVAQQMEGGIIYGFDRRYEATSNNCKWRM